ncbi:arginyltransferase [Novosphingobium resinovorum]
MTAPVRFPRFFVTSPAPCPYLPGRSERKVFTELKGPHADSLNDALGRIGFRRSQTVAYRPSCIDCNACVSVRVVASEFRASRTQKRTLEAHSDLVATVCRPWSTSEQFELLQRYLSVRHPEGGMTTMDEVDFADMVEHTPVTSYVIEYREPSIDGVVPGRLVGACLTDRQCDGLSMIYSFYDPDSERQGLGNYIILDHIRRSQDMGLGFVYLGYWVEGSARMQYKVRYRPMEKLGRAGWERIDTAEHDRLIAAAVSTPVATPPRPVPRTGCPLSPRGEGKLVTHG